MIRLLHPLVGEPSVTKLAAVLPGQSQALSVAASTAQMADMGPAQVRVLGPAMARASRHDLLDDALNAGSGPLPGALLRAYAVLGLVGALVGALIHIWLSTPAVPTTPALRASAFQVMGAAAGLLLGVVATLWPDQSRGLRRIRRELRRGRWVVLVHPTGEEQLARAEDALSRCAVGRVFRTA